jgi:uncharacterized short protein YbdD (DUF466 family)
MPYAAKIRPRILRQFWRRFWRGLREWCGDAAYERYLLAARHKSSSATTLTAEQFYIDQLNRRYSRPNRCC